MQTTGDGEHYNKENIILAIASCVITIIFSEVHKEIMYRISKRKKYGRQKGSKTIKRERRSAEMLLNELSDHGFRRMHRMSRKSFWTYDILQPNMPNPHKWKRGKAPNEDISTATRLAVTLRYLCGGDPKDIGLTHDVNATNEVLKSV